MQWLVTLPNFLTMHNNYLASKLIRSTKKQNFFSRRIYR
jgi:hypothetical protein